jgi:hypothetical protein
MWGGNFFGERIFLGERIPLGERGSPSRKRSPSVPLIKGEVEKKREEEFLNPPYQGGKTEGQGGSKTASKNKSC